MWETPIEGPTKSPVLGAAPEGARDPQSAARAVREMFTSIAPRYDLLNHLLSFNIDRLWWRRTARSFSDVLAQRARVLDLCCGTGDMTFALRRRAERQRRYSGADFSHAMLQRARRKSAGTSLRWMEADALYLPFPGEFRSGDHRLRLPQSGGLRCRPARDSSRSSSAGRMRHSGFRRTRRSLVGSCTESISSTCCRRLALWSPG